MINVDIVNPKFGFYELPLYSEEGEKEYYESLKQEK